MDKLRDKIIRFMRELGFQVFDFFEEPLDMNKSITVTYPDNGERGVICFQPFKTKMSKKVFFVQKKWKTYFAKISHSFKSDSGCEYVVFDKFKMSAGKLQVLSTGECMPKQAFEYIYEESEE